MTAVDAIICPDLWPLYSVTDDTHFSFKHNNNKNKYIWRQKNV